MKNILLFLAFLIWGFAGKGITLNKEEYPPIVAPIFNTELFAWNRRDDNDWGNATYEDRHLFLHLLIREHPYFQNYNSINNL